MSQPPPPPPNQGWGQGQGQPSANPPQQNWGQGQPSANPPPQNWGQGQQQGWGSTGHQPSAGETLGWDRPGAPPPYGAGPDRSGHQQSAQGQTYQGQAYQGQAYQGGPGQHSPQSATWVANAPGSEPPRKKSPVRLLVLLGVGVVVLGLIIGGVFVVRDMQRQEAERQAAEAARIELQTQVTGATGTVTSFLEAVRDGQLETAVSHAVTEPEGPLIDEDVFAASAKAAKVSDIEVQPAEVVKDANGVYTTATVASTYSLGGTDVERSWALTNVDGIWKLDEVTAPVTIGDRDHGLLVNGQRAEIEDSRTEALPGVYAMTTGSEFVSYKSASLVVAEPGEAVSWVGDAELTDAGRSTAIATARAAFARCVQQRTLAPANCPFSFRVADTITITEGSIRFAAQGDPFSGSQPELSGPLIRIEGAVRVTLTAEGRQGSSTGTVRGTFNQTRYAYLLAAAPNAAVTWRAG